MYFFDLQDYVDTTRARYTYWQNDSIIFGGMGLGGWRSGLVGGDFEDYMGTARETFNAWAKAVSEYFTTSLDILNEPSGSTISKLYYNDYFNAYENHIIKRQIYFNSLKTSKRLYDGQIHTGSFVGTYDDWLLYRINVVEEVVTGTTTSYYNRPMASGGTVSTPIVINYGNLTAIQYRDDYYNQFKDSLNENMRIMKTAMVLIDGDTFPDFE